MDIYPKELKAETQTVNCTPMFMAALFTVVRGWKTTQVSRVRCMDKQNVVYTAMEYYSAIKNNKNLTHAKIWWILKTLC